MFDLFVNDQLVAVCAEGVVKIFVDALVRNLGTEFTISSKRHPEEPTPEPTKEN